LVPKDLEDQVVPLDLKDQKENQEIKVVQEVLVILDYVGREEELDLVAHQVLLEQ